MNLSVAAVLIVVLGASSSVRTRDLQVEAAAAAGTELPELRDAVARALVVGGVRVVIRGPTAGACEYCTKIKVTEMSPGSYRVEVKDHDHEASTMLNVSVGARLLDHARAIAIHARLLVDRSSGWEGPAQTEARPMRMPKNKPAPASSSPMLKPQAATEPFALSEPRSVREPTPSEPRPPPAQATSAPPERVPVRTGRDESKTPNHSVEVRRPVPTEAKEVEAKRPAQAGQRETEGTTTRAVIDTAKADIVVPGGKNKPRWPWIPTTVAAGATLAAGICALMARDRYNGLSDRRQSLDSARSLKSSGESWQRASYVLAGVAAAGLAVGIAGFALGSSGGHVATAAVAPIPGGGMAMMAWEVP